ncbi:MAG: hypothetical protein WCA04_00050 [Geobacteraceae bacterium]
MRRFPVYVCVVFVLSLLVYGCGGSGSSNSTASGTTVLITGTTKAGSSVSTTSAYDGTTFSAATASFTLSSEVFSGAAHPSSVTVTSIDVSYTPEEYDATNHLMSPAIGTVYHRAIGGVIPPGGTLDLTDIMIFTSVVGAQNNAAITGLLDGLTILPYQATITFNMVEDDSNTPMTCTTNVELFLQ